MYEIEGIIEDTGTTEQKTGTFSVREFILKTEEEYPQLIKIQATQQRCDILDMFDRGNPVVVNFELRGKRAGNGNVYTNISLISITLKEEALAF